MQTRAARLINAETGRVLVEELEVARSLWKQTVGLIGRRELPASAGLLIPRCNAVHTAFVRFPIDLLFLDRASRVVHTVRELRTWRVYGPVREAKSVVELPAGRVRQMQIELGDRLTVEPAIPGPGTSIP